jgi:hypothetical protein
MADSQLTYYPNGNVVAEVQSHNNRPRPLTQYHEQVFLPQRNQQLGETKEDCIKLLEHPYNIAKKDVENRWNDAKKNHQNALKEVFAKEAKEKLNEAIAKSKAYVGMSLDEKTQFNNDFINKFKSDHLGNFLKEHEEVTKKWLNQTLGEIARNYEEAVGNCGVAYIKDDLDKAFDSLFDEKKDTPIPVPAAEPAIAGETAAIVE